MSVKINSSSPRTVTAQNHYFSLSLLIVLCFLFLHGQNSPLAGNNAALIWTAPGDDFTWGQAQKYDIRFSLVPIGSDTLNWWNYAQKLESAPYPSPAGFKDSCVIANLPIDNHVYIAIRTADESNNWSKISNIAEIPTLLCIDYTLDGSINIFDVLYLLDCIYKHGPEAPVGTISDLDNSGDTNILDALFIISFCYKAGTPPDCGD